MVARQPFRMMLPISASASCSSSMISSSVQLAADDGPHQLEALGVREDQQRPAGDVALEHLVDADEVADLVLAQGSLIAVSRLTRLTLGTDSSTCSPTMSRKLVGGTADADIDHLGQGVDLELGRGARSPRRPVDRPRRPGTRPIAFSVSGFCRNVAPTSRARVTTSTWWLAEMTASGMPGLSLSSSAARCRPSRPGMLKSRIARSKASLRSERESLVGVGRLDRGSSRGGESSEPWPRPCAQACCRRRPEPCNP